MKKFINLFIGSLCVLIFAVMSGCSSVKDKDINLVTSFYPIYIMTLNLTDGISNVSVTNMAENHTGCLHDFRLQTSDMKKIENADAFIIKISKKITKNYEKNRKIRCIYYKRSGNGVFFRQNHRI
mgnify:CR=1 FL=1